MPEMREEGEAMSYHVMQTAFEELPKRIVVREDGYMDAYKQEDIPITDYVYVRAKESNYEKLFGTPERAARTLEEACFYCDGKLACDDCVLGKLRGFRNTEDEVEEWLRGDSV